MLKQIVLIAFAAALAAGCRDAIASAPHDRIEQTRTAIRRDFSNPRDVLFRNETVLEVRGTEGSHAVVVCGEVNRIGREETAGGGWRFFYQVVSYAPVPILYKPDFEAIMNDEPGSSDKTAIPPIYAAGDLSVMGGADDARLLDHEEMRRFAVSHQKLCTPRSFALPEVYLQVSQ